MIEIQLKARHFLGARFGDSCNCAIAKALKEQFPDQEVLEAVSRCIVGGTGYTHTPYGCEDYSIDKRRAVSLRFNDTVLKTIQLEEILKPQSNEAELKIL